ncbi:hypothetical protein DOJK_02256 [Patescibacteria group bacterium]|nr:hypothetical protein DOJK_02256 [Patescibacteria group bacterium]
MLNKESFKEEIEIKLHGVSRDKCVAFAVRSALRVLPLLALHKKDLPENKAFWFWSEEDKAKHLLALFTAVSYSIEYILTKKCTAHYSSASYAVFSKAEAAKITVSIDSIASAVTEVVCATAYIDTQSVKVADEADSASAVAISSAITAVVMAANIESIIDEIQQDLSQLDHLSDTELLQQPLCIETTSDYWQQLKTNFKTDTLRLNAGFEVWLEWYEDRLNGKPIDIKLLEQWNNVPKKNRQQGVISINNYLKSLITRDNINQLNQVRAIFIGDNSHYLLEKIVQQDTIETNDITICDCLIPNTNITAHLWGFRIAPSLQQIFLREDCLYVLLLNAERNNTQQAEYWLKQLQQHTNQAKVMIVSDKAGVYLDMEYLQTKYSNIIDFYPLFHQNELEYFQKEFYQALQDIDIHKIVCTKEQLNIINFFQHQNKQTHFLSQRDFIAECIKQNITNENTRNWLITILDKLGIIFYSSQLNYLEAYLLNPCWLSQGIDTIMRNCHYQVNIQYAIKILSRIEANYSPSECRFILNVMQSFKLCYLLNESNILIMPNLLSNQTISYIPFEKTGALMLEIEFDDLFLQAVMFDVIHHFYEDMINQVVWQKGILTKNAMYYSHALLELNEQRRVLSIWVKGKDAMDYLRFLSHELSEIFSHAVLTYKEWLYLPDTLQIKHDKKLIISERVLYQQVLAFIKKKHWFYLSETGTEYDLKKLLSNEFIDNKEMINKEIYKLKRKIFFLFIVILTVSFPMFISKIGMDSKEYILEYIIYLLLVFIGGYSALNRMNSSQTTKNHQNNKD